MTCDQCAEEAHNVCSFIASLGLDTTPYQNVIINHMVHKKHLERMESNGSHP